MEDTCTREPRTADLLRQLIEMFRQQDVLSYAMSLVLPGGLSGRQQDVDAFRYHVGAISCTTAYTAALCLLGWARSPERLDAEERRELRRILEDEELRSALEIFVGQLAGLPDAAAILDCAERHEGTCILLGNVAPGPSRDHAATPAGDP